MIITTKTFTNMSKAMLEIKMIEAIIFKSPSGVASQNINKLIKTAE
jgi:hypothetical protein